MAIRVKLHGRVRTAAGSDEIEVAETVKTVGDLLEELTRRIGPDFSRYIFVPGTKEMSANLIMLVNGHSVKMLEGLRTPLLEHDMVTIDTVEVLEIVGGG